jgi:transcriptional regulator with XRE-family HTH domain
MTTRDVDPLIAELVEIRERRGLGVRETARLMGIGHMPGKISEWEVGTHTPQIHNVRRWANALGLDLALVTLPRPTTTGDTQP